MPYRVILDSNFLFLVVSTKLDIFSEIENIIPGRVQFCIADLVRRELVKLSLKKSEVGRKAEFALRLVDKCDNIKIESKNFEKVDDALVRFAGKNEVIVATSDKELRHRLRDINVPVIYVRGRSRIELEGFPLKCGG
ncbi:PIN domain-containing protein [Thermoproteota archaeon]